MESSPNPDPNKKEFAQCVILGSGVMAEIRYVDDGMKLNHERYTLFIFRFTREIANIYKIPEKCMYGSNFFKWVCPSRYVFVQNKGQLNEFTIITCSLDGEETFIHDQISRLTKEVKILENKLDYAEEIIEELKEEFAQRSQKKLKDEIVESVRIATSDEVRRVMSGGQEKP